MDGFYFMMITLLLFVLIAVPGVIGQEKSHIKRSTLDVIREHLCLGDEKGENYIGKVSWTVNENMCLSWADIVETNYTDTDFSDGSTQKAYNYCRNPGGARTSPWCYVSLNVNGSQELAKEDCFVATCVPGYLGNWQFYDGLTFDGYTNFPNKLVNSLDDCAVMCNEWTDFVCLSFTFVEIYTFGYCYVFQWHPQAGLMSVSHKGITNLVTYQRQLTDRMYLQISHEGEDNAKCRYFPKDFHCKTTAYALEHASHGYYILYNTTFDKPYTDPCHNKYTHPVYDKSLVLQGFPEDKPAIIDCTENAENKTFPGFFNSPYVFFSNLEFKNATIRISDTHALFYQTRFTDGSLANICPGFDPEKDIICSNFTKVEILNSFFNGTSSLGFFSDENPVHVPASIIGLDANRLEVRFVNSYFYNALIHLSPREYSKISFTNVSVSMDQSDKFVSGVRISTFAELNEIKLVELNVSNINPPKNWNKTQTFSAFHVNNLDNRSVIRGKYDIEKSRTVITVLRGNFTNNTQAMAVRMRGNVSFSAFDSIFINNKIGGGGAAILLGNNDNKGIFQSQPQTLSSGGTIRNCKFINNTAFTSVIDTNWTHLGSHQIGLIGEGGAIYNNMYMSAPHGHLSIRDCTFENNFATEYGGNIYNGELATMSISRNEFLHTTNNVSRYGQFLYSSGRTYLLKNNTFQSNSGSTSTSLIIHSSKDIARAIIFEAGPHEIICPYGHNVDLTYVKNPVTYAHPQLIQLEVRCTSCREDQYSLERGSVTIDFGYNPDHQQQRFEEHVEQHQVKCQGCPYGGNCKMGKVTARDNYWGYVTPNNSLEFQRCPNGYCCSSSSQTCSALQTCQANREGLLCGKCKKGYVEALLSPQCVPESECTDFWVWPAVIMSALLYIIFLIWKDDAKHRLKQILKTLSTLKRQITNAVRKTKKKDISDKSESHELHSVKVIANPQTRSLLTSLAVKRNKIVDENDSEDEDDKCSGMEIGTAVENYTAKESKDIEKVELDSQSSIQDDDVNLSSNGKVNKDNVNRSEDEKKEVGDEDEVKIDVNCDLEKGKEREDANAAKIEGGDCEDKEDAREKDKLQKQDTGYDMEEGSKGLQAREGNTDEENTEIQNKSELQEKFREDKSGEGGSREFQDKEDREDGNKEENDIKDTEKEDKEKHDKDDSEDENKEHNDTEDSKSEDKEEHDKDDSEEEGKEETDKEENEESDIEENIEEGSDEQSDEELIEEEQEESKEKGYLGILAYFYQTAVLLIIKVEFQMDRKETLLEDFSQIWTDIFKFDLYTSIVTFCPVSGLTAVTKTMKKPLFVFLMYLILFCMFIGVKIIIAILNFKGKKTDSWLCFLKKAVGAVFQVIRLSYNEIISSILAYLTCVQVGDNWVWFYDGNYPIFQKWQITAAVIVAVYVVPFCFTLGIGIAKLRRREISVLHFLVACFFPLIFLVIWAGQFIYKSYVAKKTAHNNQQKNEEMSKHDITNEVLNVLQGPYRTSGHGLVPYWESVVEGRRLVLQMLTLLTNDLIRLLLSTAVCMMILLVHITVKPFHLKRSNFAESISLCVLCVLSVIGTLQASFVEMQTIPIGPNEALFSVLDWLSHALIFVIVLVIVCIEIALYVLKTPQKKEK